MTEDKINSTQKLLEEAIDMESINNKTKEVADAATEFIRKYPIQSVLGAAALGFVLGTLLKKK